MARNSLLVNRFYNEIAAGYECCMKQVRIAGRVMRSVFIGWELRDEDIYIIEQQTKPQNPPSEAYSESLRRYWDFMRGSFVHLRPVRAKTPVFDRWTADSGAVAIFPDIVFRQQRPLTS